MCIRDRCREMGIYVQRFAQHKASPKESFASKSHVPRLPHQRLGKQSGL